MTGWAGRPWTFWLNVPLGLVLVPLACRFLVESRGAHRGFDLRGVVLGSAGLFGLVWGLVRAGGAGWARAEVAVALGAGAVALFVVWELRAPAPMLPMRFFGNRAFASANLAALLLYGALFLLTGAPARSWSSVWRRRRWRWAGWRSSPRRASPTARWSRPDAVGRRLGAVRRAGGRHRAGCGGGHRREQGQVSGAATAVRELAVVVGVAVLSAVFAGHGDLGSPARFFAGVRPALRLGAGLAAAGVVAVLAVPRRTASAQTPVDPSAPDDGRPRELAVAGR